VKGNDKRPLTQEHAHRSGQVARPLVMESAPSVRQLVRDNRQDVRYRLSVFRRDSAPG
jgi:hypothetical protein